MKLVAPAEREGPIGPTFQPKHHVDGGGWQMLACR
jgi:hypothetical protein